MQLAFTGTVVSCETRFTSDVARAYVTHFDANWVLTIEIDSTDDAAPWRAGDRVAFPL